MSITKSFMQNVELAESKTANAAPEKTYAVTVEWVPEEKYENGDTGGKCYVTHDSDISGLILEARSLDEMKEHMLDVVPHLLELGHKVDSEKAKQISVRMLGEENLNGMTKYEIKHPA